VPGWEIPGMVALAKVRHELLDPVAAIKLLYEALNRDPLLSRSRADYHEVKRLLATCLLEAGRSREAREQLESLLKAKPDPQVQWLFSRALLMEGDSSGAVAAIARAESDGEPNPLRQEPAPFVGAARCRACHSGEYESQQRSRHAQTILPRAALDQERWPEKSFTDPSNQEVTHSFRQVNGRVEATANSGNRIYAALIDYAMGSNHQGRSFVGRDRDGQARELRISRYPSPPEWDKTSEHPKEPRSPDGYLGRPIADESVRRCVHCHSTDFRAIQEPEGRPEAVDRGIGCERCHGPGAHHVRAVEQRFPDLAIARPRLATASQVVALCSQCHKAPESASPSSASFIRFQGPTLVQSRCYTESGSMSCVTCHNPHRDAGRTASQYEAICLRCHSANQTAEATADAMLDLARSWPPCPVNPKRDCLSCHMPRVPDAVPRATFTDHYIRIRAEARR